MQNQTPTSEAAARERADAIDHTSRPPRRRTRKVPHGSVAAVPVTSTPKCGEAAGSTTSESNSFAIEPSHGQRGSAAPAYFSIERAALNLDTTPRALRARCRRAARKKNGATVADLGGEIVAVKIGKSWRIRFPNP
jgi:hypothetical protein